MEGGGRTTEHGARRMEDGSSTSKMAQRTGGLRARRDRSDAALGLIHVRQPSSGGTPVLVL
jgi:hypothetical protein